ncbi:MerR family transcriptional regulator [Larsenimonas rhizosphaerae]|uniref:MerR family DNA-binding protein n=1 Tax=Larsenimonas rhizosphaerae TaxID=2944682 RepID=A0AA41ZI56_9GAMM|nr:MerR family DNA-binding protein [Larsenimonas rhizosphaerae]MCM2131649.1 MerR family DNA-binding protein [Larsenimonas rhizosphaerae]MCX2525025.1 MerR family DNA-binding protein [Larsenimonas rhizosphaerae]
MRKVSELASAAGVTAETVRHYTREGLISSNRNPHNGYQLYDEQALRRLRFIQQARTLGFSLREIRDILAHTEHGDSPCPMVRDLLAARLPQIREEIHQLQQLADRMEQALATWSAMPDAAPDGHTLCRLIEHWEPPAATIEQPGADKE